MGDRTVDRSGRRRRGAGLGSSRVRTQELASIVQLGVSNCVELVVAHYGAGRARLDQARPMSRTSR